MNLDEADFLKMGFSPALAQSVVENGTYALGLRDGTTIHFEEADFNPNAPLWLHLRTLESEKPEDTPNFDEGIDVRLADIVWVADTEK